ncbi:lactosylceramide 4-alpha-galactosyltransferase-like [Haemaphysalis longicornis]
MDALRRIANVRITRLDLADLFAGTPLRYWGANNPNGNGAATLARAARFALLWKYGGVYADLDVVVRRPVLGALRNCMGQRGGEERDSPTVSGAVLVFDKGHSLMELCMEDVARQHHDSRLLVISASEALARTLRDHYVCRRHESPQFAPARELRCADGPSWVTVMPQEAFFSYEAQNSTPPHLGAAHVRDTFHHGTRSYFVRQVWPSGLSARHDHGHPSWASRTEADLNCPHVYRRMKLDKRLI